MIIISANVIDLYTAAIKTATDFLWYCLPERVQMRRNGELYESFGFLERYVLARDCAKLKIILRNKFNVFTLAG